MTALTVVVVLDLAVAQMGNWFLPQWNPSNAERTYRTQSPIYHHGLRPNVDVQGVWRTPYSFRTNNLGLRDVTVRTVQRDAPHLLLLGDSFTEGIGVPYEETFASHLNAAAHGVEVLNAAVMSYAPAIYYRKTRYLLEELGVRIDAVVVALDLSDVPDELLNYRLDLHGNVVDARAQGWRERLATWLPDHSVLGRVAWTGLLWWERRGGRWEPGLNPVKADWNLSDSAFARFGVPGLRIAREHMDSLRALTQRHGIPLVVVVYPWPSGVRQGIIGTRHERYWQAWADSAGAGFVDLYPTFINGEPADSVLDRYYLPADVHWSPAGHRLVANVLLNGIVGELLGARPAGASAGARVTAGPHQSRPAHAPPHPIAK